MPDPPPSLDPVQLGAYFALIEVVGLLRHAVEQQLREAGDLSYVQFQLLARLGGSPTGSHRMTDDAAKVQKLLRQQAAIASFGSFALRQRDLSKILAEAVRVCAEGLNVPFSKVCQYRAEQNDLLIVAGYGWQDGVVGDVVSRADMSSPQGRASQRAPTPRVVTTAAESGRRP